MEEVEIVSLGEKFKIKTKQGVILFFSCLEFRVLFVFKYAMLLGSYLKIFKPPFLFIVFCLGCGTLAWSYDQAINYLILTLSLNLGVSYSLVLGPIFSCSFF